MGDYKHILVSVGYYPPDHTGAGLRLHRVYRRLADILPIRLTVLARSGREEPSGWHTYEGVRVYRTPLIRGKIDSLLEVSKFFLSDGIGTFDLVHASGSFRTVVSSCIWANWLGIPILRESTMSDNIGAGNGLKQKALNWSFVNSDVAIARTRDEEERLRDIGVDKERIYRVSYPIDDHTFCIPSSDQRKEARSKFGLPHDAPVHLIIGKLGPRKNQRFALCVLSQLPEDHHLVLVGPPKGNYPQQLRRRADELAVRDRLKIVDEHISNVVPYYWAADTLWVTSRKEGVPNVMKEALVCGIPVVMNAALRLQEQGSENEGFYHAPLDVPVFKQAVKRATETFQRPRAQEQLHRIGQRKFGVSVWGEEFAGMISQISDGSLRRVEDSRS